MLLGGLVSDTTPGAELFSDKGSEACFPLPNSLVGKVESPFDEHLGQVSEAALVSEPPQDNEEHNIGWEFQEVEWCASSLVERTPAS
jgi:hypothetical protein